MQLLLHIITKNIQKQTRKIQKMVKRRNKWKTTRRATASTGESIRCENNCTGLTLQKPPDTCCQEPDDEKKPFL